MYRLTIDIDPNDPMEIIFAQFLIALRKARQMAEEHMATEESRNYWEESNEQNTLSQSV